ncbi:MAG: XylR N-terminal domain-containing protein, partial [Myxococcales bacterium]|nr:XylR N-terminal domain-containing protein [Myxococcales bacterium]
MNLSPDGAAGHDLAEIEFDPFAVLERDSRILLNPSFLTALHQEIEGELGAEQSRITLFQMGFLHGLQDAYRALGAGEKAHALDREHIIAPPLHMDLRSHPEEAETRAIELHGSWPECHEAAAHLRSVGATRHSTCYLSAGYTSGWLSGTFNANIVAHEIACSAAGCETCRFVAREAEAWLGLPEPEVHALLDALPFDAFRAAVREREAHERVLQALEALGEGA